MPGPLWCRSCRVWSAGPRRRTGHLEAPAPGGELADDFGCHRCFRVVAAQGLAALADPGQRTVESVADAVEHACLAGTGLAVEQEDAALREGIEVDGGSLGERTEGFEFETVYPHFSTFSLRTWASTETSRSSSAWLSGRLRTCSTNPEQTSIGDLACASRSA